MKQTVVIYTRVSTDKQTTGSQLASLREYCARHNWHDVQVIADTISGSKISRKGLDQLMKAVRAEKVDVVLCYNLDRLGRSLSHLVHLLGEFATHKVALIVPGQGINTSSSNPASALLFNMLGAIAQFEHSIIVERVNAGLAAARRRGIKLGRPGTPGVHREAVWPNYAHKAVQGAPLPKSSESRARRSSNSSPVFDDFTTPRAQENAPARRECRRCPGNVLQALIDLVPRAREE